MKTAKLALKIILALALPLNAMAFGLNGSGSERSIESRIELQNLKLQRTELQRELARAATTIEVLHDIASDNPDLASFYREHDEAVIVAGTLGVVGISILGAVATRTAPKIGRVISGVGLLAAIGLSVVAVKELMTPDDYDILSASLKGSSMEFQKSVYVQAWKAIDPLTKALDAINQQIAALEGK